MLRLTLKHKLILLHLNTYMGHGFAFDRTNVTEVQKHHLSISILVRGATK